ncbi:hypothetical protein [Hydrogeniiclostridium mannosilyticum]|uniref:hypothetical protein n=1 Tax=Hydrogeniiclostridium mannosilyticum TaxID=2764322 RepID=UPI00399BD922
MFIGVKTVSPVITSYPTYAAHLSLADVYLDTSSKETYMNWFILQYISTVCYLDEKRRGYILFDNILGGNDLPDSKIFYKEIFNGIQIQEECISFKKFLIDRLKSGFSIFMTLNRKFILEQNTTYDDNHETLISGYDTDKDCFYLSDFYAGRKFQKIQVDSVNVEKAFSTFTYLNRPDLAPPDIGFNTNIYTLQRYASLQDAADVTVVYDPYTLLFMLERWLGAKQIGYLALGRKCYDIQAERLQEKNFDLRNFHLLYDHKIALLKSIEYLILMKKIPYVEDLLKQVKSLVDKTLILRNRLIKDRIAQRVMPENWLEQLNSIKHLDEIVFSKLYHLIKKTL